MSKAREITERSMIINDKTLDNEIETTKRLGVTEGIYTINDKTLDNEIETSLSRVVIVFQPASDQ